MIPIYIGFLFGITPYAVCICIKSLDRAQFSWLYKTAKVLT